MDTMLEHQKKVLECIFDYPELFKKELIKSSGWLSTYEYNQLKKWVIESFDQRHHNIIEEVLGTTIEHDISSVKK